jgi:formylglycine-generating enzyme required for sulfatase activity
LNPIQRILHAVLGAIFLLACPPGRTPPQPTEMIEVSGGKLTFGPPVAPDAGMSDAIHADADPSYAGATMVCQSSTSKDVATARCDSNLQDFPITWLPRATSTVEKFCIDKHEVTNAQYRLCVEDEKCDPPVETTIKKYDGTIVEYFGDRFFDNYPAVYVDRQDAANYCAYMGVKTGTDMALPREDQWEWAARYSAEESALAVFPWGNNWVGCADIIVQGCGEGLPDAVTTKRIDHTSLDIRYMASNVAEWVADGWDSCAYCSGATAYGELNQQCEPESCDPEIKLCSDPGYTFSTNNLTRGVIRGGSYYHDACHHRLYVRKPADLTAKEPWLGFRCVRNLSNGDQSCE